MAILARYGLWSLTLLPVYGRVQQRCKASALCGRPRTVSLEAQVGVINILEVFSYRMIKAKSPNVSTLCHLDCILLRAS